MLSGHALRLAVLTPLHVSAGTKIVGLLDGAQAAAVKDLPLEVEVIDARGCGPGKRPSARCAAWTHSLATLFITYMRISPSHPPVCHEASRHLLSLAPVPG